MNDARRHPVRCRCGALRAELRDPRSGTRGICYCRDCQAFAHFLGPPPGMLDRFGGTDVLAIRPRCLAFTGGLEHLACMSLSPRGTLRWYARCCKTPIGNTPRDRRIAHLGLVHSCLAPDDAALEAAFGPPRLAVNRASAHGEPPRVPALRAVLATARYAAGLAGARVSGAWRVNPFFEAHSGAPIVEPQVIPRAAREALDRAVARAGVGRAAGG